MFIALRKLCISIENCTSATTLISKHVKVRLDRQSISCSSISRENIIFRIFQTCYRKQSDAGIIESTVSPQLLQNRIKQKLQQNQYFLRFEIYLEWSSPPSVVFSTSRNSLSSSYRPPGNFLSTRIYCDRLFGVFHSQLDFQGDIGQKSCRTDYRKR